MVVWSDEAKSELFLRYPTNYVWWTPGTTHHHLTNIIPTVKPGAVGLRLSSRDMGTG